jgi:hypothetical protein
VSETSTPSPLEQALEACARERRCLLALPFTAAASKALEEVDAAAEELWAALAPGRELEVKEGSR